METDTSVKKKSLKSFLSRFKSGEYPWISSDISRSPSPLRSSASISRVNSDSSISSTKSSLGKKSLAYGKKVDTLGSGVSATVDLYYRKSTNEFFAIKTFKPREPYESRQEYKAKCYQEYQLVNDLNSSHQNIIRVYAFISGFSSHQIVMDFHPYPFLKVIKAIRPETEEVLCFFRQVCEGINYLHLNFISHRDLKMENLVLDASSTVKIIDFGTSFNFTPSRIKATGVVGTEALISPEALRSVHYDSEANDVWSLGILLYSMLNLEFPWKSVRESDREFIQFKEDPLILKDKYPVQIWGTIIGVLQIDATKRISISDLITGLSATVCEHANCLDILHARTLRICDKRFKLPVINS